MKITVNGESKLINENYKLYDLLNDMELVGKRVAVEINEELVTRSAFQNTVLSDNDRIEIVAAIGGG